MTPRAPAEYAALFIQGVELDEEIAQTHGEGYDADVLLENRLDWQRQWAEAKEAA